MAIGDACWEEGSRKGAKEQRRKGRLGVKLPDWPILIDVDGDYGPFVLYCAVDLNG